MILLCCCRIRRMLTTTWAATSTSWLTARAGVGAWKPICSNAPRAPMPAAVAMSERRTFLRIFRIFLAIRFRLSSAVPRSSRMLSPSERDCREVETNLQKWRRKKRTADKAEAAVKAKIARTMMSCDFARTSYAVIECDRISSANTTKPSGEMLIYLAIDKFYIAALIHFHEVEGDPMHFPNL